jgi:hypothetical protein
VITVLNIALQVTGLALAANATATQVWYLDTGGFKGFK